MKISVQLLIPVMAVIAACGGAGSTDSTPKSTAASNTNQFAAMPADSQIAALVYDISYSVPQSFFVDERSGTQRSYTVHHVLDQSLSYEVCTDDYAAALAWEEADNASRGVQGYFVESNDNERYFEFVRELSYESDIGNIDDLTSPGFARVFKCSNTNRDGVDRSLLSGYAGMLNALPLTQDSVRIYAEYLWQFTFFPNSRKKVLDSSAAISDTAIRQTLLLAFSTNQGTDRCDLIEVAKWEFSADPYTGRVDKRFKIVHSFEAKVEHGATILCN